MRTGLKALVAVAVFGLILVAGGKIPLNVKEFTFGEFVEVQHAFYKDCAAAVVGYEPLQRVYAVQVRCPMGIGTINVTASQLQRATLEVE